MAAPPTSIQTSGQEPDLPADGADAVELAERNGGDELAPLQGDGAIVPHDEKETRDAMSEASAREIDIPIVNIDKGLNGVARYIVVVMTGDGRRWGIAKRFSDFYDLKTKLSLLEIPLRNGSLVRDLPFPPKQLWGGSADDVISYRIPALRRWCNSIIKLAPESRAYEAEVNMFLAEDLSVDERTLKFIGLDEERVMSTGRGPGETAQQLVPQEYEDGEYDVLNHPDKSHSITPRARFNTEGNLQRNGLRLGMGIGGLGTQLINRPKVETTTLGVIQDYEIGDITNRMDVLEGIDHALGFTGPPDLEFIFNEEVRGAVQTLVPFGFGHAAVRYRVPWTGDKFLGRRYNKTLRTAEHGGIGQDKQYVANITRGRGVGSVVEMWECPEDYMLGAGGGKGGIFTRSMCSIRIQKVDEDSLRAIHHFFKALGNGSQNRHIRKYRSPSAAVNFVRWVFQGIAPTGQEVISGSGAQYVAQTLFGAGLLDRTHTMPKAVWVDLFESQLIEGASGKNGAVVYYKQAESGMHRLQGTGKSKWWWPWSGPRTQRYRIVRSFVSIFQLYRSWVYWDMERFADVRTRALPPITSLAHS